MDQEQPAAVPTDVWQLTPDQATAALAVKKQEFDAANAPAASPAQRRLQTIFSDEKLKNSYLSGSVALKNEVERLHAEMLTNGDEPGGFVETVNAIDDPAAQTRAAYARLVGHLREQGLDPGLEAFLIAADGGQSLQMPTQGDRVVAKRALDRLMAGKTTEDLVKDYRLKSDFTTLNAVIGLSVEDGKPASEGLKKLLAAHGLL